MVSGKNLVSGVKSEYTYNGLFARVKKTSGTTVSTYMPDYSGGIQNDLVTQISGTGTVNAVYGQGYGRISQRFMPEADAGAADTYFQHDLYESTLFAADAQGAIKHHAAHDIWGMPQTACDDRGTSAGLRFTTYEYDPVLEKHFAHARIYDPAHGRMLGTDPVKRGLNGYVYCDNDPANQTDPTGEVANVVIGGIAGAVIGGAFGFAGSALSQMVEGKGFNARKAWGAAANGAIVGAARGALIGSGAGIPLAFGVNFAAGMAGSLAEQKITGAHIAPVRAAVDGVFNAAGGRLYGTSPLKNVRNAFMRGALEGAVKGGAYNMADVLDNKLRNAYGSENRRNPRTRNPWNKNNRNPWNSRNPRPTGSRSPQSHCGRPKPLKGMRNPKRGSSRNRIYRTHHALPNDKFRIRSFVRDVVAGAVMGGLASVAFYGAGKAVEALKRGVQRRIRKPILEGSLSLVFGDDETIRYAKKIAPPTTKDRFIVIGHGSPYGIMVNGKEEGAGAIAVQIRKSKEFVGGHQVVWLYCCETGKEPKGFAQQLANILEVTVMAPDKNVHPLGKEFKVGYRYRNMFTGKYEWVKGKFNKFSPNVTILRHKK